MESWRSFLERDLLVWLGFKSEDADIGEVGGWSSSSEMRFDVFAFLFSFLHLSGAKITDGAVSSTSASLGSIFIYTA